jgi:hypothetical protein
MSDQNFRGFLYSERGAGDGKPGDAIRFKASTPGIKRDGLDLDPRDFLLDNYRKNPVVLWAHDMWGRNLPVGRASVEITLDALVADVTFDQEDEFARLVESKYRRGFLNAVSISWNDVRVEGGYGHELLEISAVPVPADPDALVEREARGLENLRRSLNEVLGGSQDPQAETNAAWREVAGHMVGLFCERGGVGEEDRRTRYNDLERRYRRMKRVAPEYRSAKELEALGVDELRGLFLEGEDDLFPDAFKPVMRVTGRNKSAIQQALELLQTALAEEPVEEQPQPEPEPEDTSELEAIRDQLDSILKKTEVISDDTP